MCGIAGFLGPWTTEHLELMQSYLRHRGPDDKGLHFDKTDHIGMAHTRLSIIDLASGQQPLSNADESIFVVFNGEIYNHHDLREELINCGFQLKCKSDGEVISHLYEKYGIEFVKKLRGMFAIALWDSRNKKLFLIRDRFGIKPVYFRNTNEGFLFASEIKAILAIDRVTDIDPQAFDWYMSFRYVPEDRTMFSGIYKLLPGHWMEISTKEIRTERYWDLRTIEPGKNRTEQQWADDLKEKLREAVEIRLMSEVPLGSFLSGGLDSSFIVGLMSQMSNKPVETFSFGVGSGWHNETSYAEEVSEFFNTSHHPLSGDCNEPELFKRVIWYLDEPLADTAVIPTFLLSKLTREFVTVALTGEGADELLGGYDKYKVLLVGDRIGKFVPEFLLRPFTKVTKNWNKLFRGLNFLASSRDRARAYMELVSVFHESEKQNLYSETGKKFVKKAESSSQVIKRILDDCKGTTYLDDLFQIDLMTWLPNDVLLKADKMTMAHGLEGRVPFLDHKFAEFCSSIPANLKVKKWQEKYILRKAMQGFVPDSIIKRKKHGFTVSLKPWANGGENSTLRSILSKENIERRGLFNFAEVDKLLNKDLDDPYVRRQVTSLLTFELWAQVFIDTTDLSQWNNIKM